jgi:hypothetical protein
VPGAHGELTERDLSRVCVIVDAAAVALSKETLYRSVSNAVEGVLLSPLVRSLKLEDVRILRINDPAGWNGSLLFNNVTSRETDRAGAVGVEAKGCLNG